MLLRRIDKLALKSFIGPFCLATVVATFILLIQYMVKYFDDFVGKNLGFTVFAELIFYFSLNMLSVSLPLGVLMSSIMTFGNLAEHFELTAIKGSGISLLRTLRPIFVFVFFLSIGSFLFNNYVVPIANLKAYSLLYDIKHTKPALDIKPGVFYNGIPDYSIKVKEKRSDNQTLREVLIYDHTQKLGNKSVIIADSSKMYTFENNRYLKLELYDGSAYNEQKKNLSRIDYLQRTYFDQMEIVFDLSSFGLRDTDEALFRNNRQMKNVAELTDDIDSMSNDIMEITMRQYELMEVEMGYHFSETKVDKMPQDSLTDRALRDSTEAREAFFATRREMAAGDISMQKAEDIKPIDAENKPVWSMESDYREVVIAEETDTLSRNYLNHKPIHLLTPVDLAFYYKQPYQKQAVLEKALTKSRNIKAQLNSTKARLTTLRENYNRYSVEKYKKFSQAFACLVMFLIGGPLGAIIKKGGLGVPVIVSVFFFIIYYVLTITSEKWARAGITDPMWSAWSPHFLLFPAGLFFLRQARIDARLLDVDFYVVISDKLKRRFPKMPLLR